MNICSCLLLGAYLSEASLALYDVTHTSWRTTYETNNVLAEIVVRMYKRV